MTTSSKSTLIDEIEKRLLPSDYDFVGNQGYVAIVDFMSYIRSQKVDKTTFKTFGECIDKIFNRLVTTYENSLMFHLIFDSYIEQSWKSGTRQKRVRGVVHLANISSETPLPVQMEKFWGSETNKELMQSYFCENLKVLAMKKKVPLVLSGTIKDETALPAQYVDVDHELVENIQDLTLEIEEADLRIIPHIAWNIKRNRNISNFIVISRDTDVIVLLLFYFKQFSELGAMRIWIVIGAGEKKTISANPPFIFHIG